MISYTKYMPILKKQTKKLMRFRIKWFEHYIKLIKRLMNSKMDNKDTKLIKRLMNSKMDNQE